MEKNLVLLKLKTLHKEYSSYKDYYENFLEGVDGRKKEIAAKISSEDFEKDLEDFVLDAFVLKHVYEGDLSILLDKIQSYYNAARLMGIEKEVDEETTRTVKNSKDREFKPRFIIENGKPIEVSEGFIEEQRKQIKEQGNITKLVQKLNIK